jgi:tetratricopeptide (TPR) repeat protein
MDTTEQKVSEEQKSKDTSSGETQPANNNKNTVIGRLLSPLRMLSVTWAFKTFNVIILLVILFLLLFQPHWKKGNSILTAIGIKEIIPSSTTDSGDTVTESLPEQGLLKDSEDFEGQGDETTITPEIEYADIDKANELYELKEYEQALTEYIKVADQSTSSTDEDLVQYRIGECYQELGRFDEALDAYRNIVTGSFHDPYQVKIRLREGECLVAKGDYLKARKLLFTLMAQEARFSDEDKDFIIEAYYKIAESYMKEALRYAHIQGYTFTNEKQ